MRASFKMIRGVSCLMPPGLFCFWGSVWLLKRLRGDIRVKYCGRVVFFFLKIVVYLCGKSV